MAKHLHNKNVDAKCAHMKDPNDTVPGICRQVRSGRFCFNLDDYNGPSWESQAFFKENYALSKLFFIISSHFAENAL